MPQFHPHVTAHHSLLSTAIFSCLREANCIVGKGWACPFACRNQQSLFGRLQPLQTCQSEHQPACRSSLSLSVMIVYRITDLTCSRSALISGRCSAFIPLHITQNSFQKTPRLLQSVWWKHTRYETEQEADFFFSFPVAVLTTVKCDLSETRYMFLRGGRGELRSALKGNMSDGCQPPPISWRALFLIVHAEFLLLWLFPTLDSSKTNSHERSERPCGRHMLDVGWFKLINVSRDPLCFSGCTNSSFSISALLYSFMMKPGCK